MPRGILATCTAKLTGDLSADDAYEVYVKVYADEPFVHLLPQGQWPQTKSVLGSNGLGVNGYGDLSPGGYSLQSGLIIETVLTFGFLIVILGRQRQS